MTWRPVCTSIIFFIVFANTMSMVTLAVTDPYLPINISLSEINDGSNIDVSVGANLNIFLKVPSQEIYERSCLWSNVTVSGDPALQEVQRAVLLPTGVTGAFFQAIRPGLAELKSHRYDCSRRLTVEWRVGVRVI
jgi:hypothetical protein